MILKIPQFLVPEANKLFKKENRHGVENEAE
jgi:hypothetical protein